MNYRVEKHPALLAFRNDKLHIWLSDADKCHFSDIEPIGFGSYYSSNEVPDYVPIHNTFKMYYEVQEMYGERGSSPNNSPLNSDILDVVCVKKVYANDILGEKYSKSNCRFAVATENVNLRYLDLNSVKDLKKSAVREVIQAGSKVLIIGKGRAFTDEDGIRGNWLEVAVPESARNKNGKPCSYYCGWIFSGYLR